MINMDTIKSTNYIMNSYAASTSKDKGGYLGIIIDHNGNVLVCYNFKLFYIVIGSINGEHRCVIRKWEIL